jgi:hypothetical protein
MTVAKHTINEDQTMPWNIDESGKTWTLAKDAKLSINMSTGVTENSLQHDNKIVINGDITVTDFIKMNDYRAIALFGDDTQLTIGKDSKVTSDYGVTFSSEGGRMTNNGIIDTVNQGVTLSEAKVTLINSGLIDGNTAVQSFGDKARIVNSANGEIEGSIHAVSMIGVGSSRLENDGVLRGDAAAFYGGEGKNHVVNTGKMVGDVELGAGNDTFDNRGGVFKFTVEGGTGDDTYITDKAGIDIAEDLMLGGTDRVKSTVSFSLARDGNEGIENLTALGQGNIKLTGNDTGNRLTGNAGDNRIDGGLGMDMLIGRQGADTFVFKTGYGQDTIKDFKDGTDRIDVSDWAGMDNIKDIKQQLTVDGDNLVLTVGTDELVLEGVSKADINAGDFLFG